jgi:hypothetical protein
MNGMMITRGHPIFVKPAHHSLSSSTSSAASSIEKNMFDWWRPDELTVTSPSYVASLHNLVLDTTNDDTHTVIVDGVICCTIGRDCGDRLRRLHPHHHLKYGPSSSLVHHHPAPPSL